MEKTNRAPRELETREKAERPKQWMPPKLLPDPKPEAGYAFRWIRIASQGKDDATNYSSKLAEGWEPLKRPIIPRFVCLILLRQSFQTVSR